MMVKKEVKKDKKKMIMMAIKTKNKRVRKEREEKMWLRC